MPLIVHTARIGFKDPDVFDITRATGGVDGAPFAPSWRILRPALHARDRAKKKTLTAAAASALFEPIWQQYEPAYRSEMLYSYQRHRAAWDALLARKRVVLVCYCADPTHCHRRLLARYLGRLGADVRDEFVTPARVAAPARVARAR